MDVSLELQRAVGARIQKRRKALKWTAAKLGESLGVSQQWVSRVERGEENITLGTLAKVAEALGVEARELMP